MHPLHTYIGVEGEGGRGGGKLTEVDVGRSICISTTSPSMISVSSLNARSSRSITESYTCSSKAAALTDNPSRSRSSAYFNMNVLMAIETETYLMRTPIDFRNACVSASVLLISREKISLPAMAVNGVSVPKACAIPWTEKDREGEEKKGGREGKRGREGGRGREEGREGKRGREGEEERGGGRGREGEREGKRGREGGRRRGKE